MQKVTSISGGMSSAYCAANYPTDYNVFALVRTSDPKCKYPDKKLRSLVEDRIQMPFVGTLEDDMIIHTILDLEQFLGKKIDWVSGITFDEVVDDKGGWLPCKHRRYCTYHMKIEPIFHWWHKNFNAPVGMQIGFRCEEGKRIKKKLSQTNKKDLLEFEVSFEKHQTGPHKGKNKWEFVEWQKPLFPMATDMVTKTMVQEYWKGKNVRFAPLNNCVGCFHKTPLLLAHMFKQHPTKLNWFDRKEQQKMKINRLATWRQDTTYTKIKNSKAGSLVGISDFNSCDNGYCGL